MKKTQFIELVSLIKTTLVSFLSIVLFVGMGITLYAGITWAMDAYQEHIDSALAARNASDLQIASPLGLTDDDLAAIAQVDGVSTVEPVYVSYQSASSANGVLQCAVYSMTDNVNTLTVMEGTLPTKPDEVALLYNSTMYSDYRVGDTITFDEDEGSSSASSTSGIENNSAAKYLTQRSYTITALVLSAEYLCNYEASLGVNNAGQQVDCILFATKDAFNAEAFDNAYPIALATCDSLRNLSTFEDSYKTQLSSIIAAVEQTGEPLAQSRYQAVKEAADAKISSNQKKLDEAKEKIDDGDKRAASAEKTLNSKSEELTEAQAKLNSAIAKYNSEKSKGKAKLAKGKRKIKRYTKKLTQARKLYASAKAKVDQSKQLASTLEQIASDAKGRYQAILEGVETHDSQWFAKMCEDNNEKVSADIAQVNEKFPSYSSKVDPLLEGLKLDADNIEESAKSAYTSLAGISVAVKQINEKRAAAQKKIDKLKAGISKLESGIASGKAKLAAGRKRYKQKIADAKAQIEEARSKIASGKAKLSEGEEKLSEKEETLEDSRTKYEDGKEQLSSAREAVSKIASSNWAVNSRNYNSAVQMVETTCKALGNLRLVMASLFIIIGLLVCYSVMSRLVHERMKLLGTKKALGLKRSEISRQFLGYSLLACILGTLLGIVVGAPIVQMILVEQMNQYVLPAPGVLIHLADIIGVCLLQIVLIGASSWLACRAILRKNAVDLLAGQRPSSAKRHFYENWRVWGKLGLLTQTMINNCINDRRRMFGTFVGVAGCTALIACALTIQTSISNTTSMQDDFVERYDYEVFVTDGSLSSSDSGTTVDSVLASHGVEPVTAMCGQMGINMPDGSRSAAKVIVPQNNEEIDSIMGLNITEGSSSLSDQGALVSCSYGKYFDVKVGDTITLTKSDGNTYQVPITGFFDYYGGVHVVIMSAQTYQHCIGDAPSFTARLMKADNVNMGELESSLTQAADYAGFSDSRAISHTISDSINSLAMTVVAVYIGISALVALFVLLNLNVMFVEEKKIELIVMMINGYDLRDAKRYVSRDSIIMDSLGMVAGCVLGSIMGIMATKSIESELLVFIVGPSALACAAGIVICGAFSFIVMQIALRKVNKYRLTEAAG